MSVPMYPLLISWALWHLGEHAVSYKAPTCDDFVAKNDGITTARQPDCEENPET